jgi:hypothetical protein
MGMIRRGGGAAPALEKRSQPPKYKIRRQREDFCQEHFIFYHEPEPVESGKETMGMLCTSKVQ